MSLIILTLIMVKFVLPQGNYNKEPSSTVRPSLITIPKHTDSAGRTVINLLKKNLNSTCGFNLQTYKWNS